MGMREMTKIQDIVERILADCPPRPYNVEKTEDGRWTVRCDNSKHGGAVGWELAVMSGRCGKQESLANLFALAVNALEPQREALRLALSIIYEQQFDCASVHHNHDERHEFDEECPVLKRIAANISKCREVLGEP